jgi:hypothetical protein
VILDAPNTRTVIERARRHAKDPTGPALEQQSLFASMA